MGVMAKGGGGGSLRDVLLGSNGGRVGSSGGGTSRGGALTWRSLRSVSGTVDAVDPRGHFFPAKLALSLALLKLLLAILMVSLGAFALILQAALSNLGAGLWAGAVVGVSGFLGVCASRRPYAHVYVVSFMCVAILSMASSGLLIILSATAWARDSQYPTAVFVEQDTQEEVKVLGEVLVRRPSVLVSGALVLLGVLDCMVSLACATVSAREACGLYSKSEDRAQGLSEGHNRKERLYRWLGQQKTIFPLGSSQPPPRGISSVSQFVPLSSSDSSSSATPRKSDPSAASSSIHPSSSSNRTHRTTHTTPSHISSRKTTNSRITQESSTVPSILKASSLPHIHASHSLPSTAAHIESPKEHKGHPQHNHEPMQQHMHPHGPSSFPYPQHLHKHQGHPHQHPHLMQQMSPYPHPHMLHQQPPMRHHYPTHASHPSLFYPHLLTPMMPHYPVEQEYPPEQRKHKHKKKEGKKHKDKEAKKEKKKSKKSKKELTDEQIERTYTGLDREIAEDFIDSTMEPGISIHRAMNASFENDSF